MKRLTQIGFNPITPKILLVTNIVLALSLASSLYFEKMRLLVWFSEAPVTALSMTTILYTCWMRGRIIFPKDDSKPPISLGASIIGSLLSFGFGAFYYGFWQRLLYPGCRDISYAREAFGEGFYNYISSSVEDIILGVGALITLVLFLYVIASLIIKAIAIKFKKNMYLYERRRFYLLCIELFVFTVFYNIVAQCNFISCYH